MITRDEISRMAHDVGFGDYAYEARSVFERFFHAAYAAGVATEREACAKVCDTHTVDDVLFGVGIAQSCAALIRARGEK